MRSNGTVQQYVTGEITSTGLGLFPTPAVQSIEEPEGALNTTEPSLSEQLERAEQIDSGELKPTATVQQRRFSVDWDPTR